jgi:hypothetical protein
MTGRTWGRYVGPPGNGDRVVGEAAVSPAVRQAGGRAWIPPLSAGAWIGFFLSLVVCDWKTRRRVHPVTLAGCAWFLRVVRISEST